MVNGERYSIISDYIGRPIQVYNDVGEVVWETEYDIYGRLKNLKGDRAFQPFRQVGQYEDVELEGLYLNRFRFYDSNTGLYISQDPIGLNGGFSLYSYVWDVNSFVDIFGLLGGGSYYSVRNSNIGGEVHHMPANSINGLSHSQGPSIWMETLDHQKTASHGWQGKQGALYRQQQLDLINQGKWHKALEMDIKDIQTKFGDKYNKSINEMLEYSHEKGLITKKQKNKLKVCH